MMIPEGGLLQSEQWAAFWCASDKEVVEISYGGHVIFGVRTLLPVVGFHYLYVPRLPEISDGLLRAIVRAAQDHHCHWVRVDLMRQSDVDILQGMSVGALRAPHDMQPAENFIIDIDDAPEDLLGHMKAKTRYNIRLAQKKDVEVSVVRAGDHDFTESFGSFYRLVEETARRKGVRFHDKSHYAHMFTALSRDVIALYVAKYQNEIIAANIVTFYGDTVTYLHGATGEAHRSVMAPFLLQWQAILDAKDRGCTRCDLGGYYTSTDDPGKQGISRFKKGFAPQVIPTVSAGSWDITISPLCYRAYQFLRKLKG